MNDGSQGHSKERTASIRSLMKKFNIGSASVFIMGIEALLQMERDINDIISFGQYVKACYYKRDSKITRDMEGSKVFDYIYIYAIYTEKQEKLVVAYKDNPEKTSFNLKTMKVKTIDPYVLEHFTTEKGTLPK